MSVSPIPHQDSAFTSWPFDDHNGDSFLDDRLVDDELPGINPETFQEEKELEQMLQDKMQAKELRSGRWTIEEDELLKRGVAQYGTDDWNTVGRLLNRKALHCKRRWDTVTNPDLKKGNWEKQELIAIVNAHEIKCNNWKDIAIAIESKRDAETIRKTFLSLLHVSKVSQENPTYHEELLKWIEDNSEEYLKKRQKAVRHYLDNSMIPPAQKKVVSSGLSDMHSRLLFSIRGKKTYWDYKHVHNVSQAIAEQGDVRCWDDIAQKVGLGVLQCKYIRRKLCPSEKVTVSRKRTLEKKQNETATCRRRLEFNGGNKV